MKLVNLQGSPRPHYLTEAEISADGTQVSGRVVFPSTDPTIADRVDHVNVAHHLFAVWNAAHLLARNWGFKHPLVRKLEVKLYHITKPDVPVQLKVQIHDAKDMGKSVSGKLRAIFTDGDRILSEVKASFTIVR